MIKLLFIVIACASSFSAHAYDSKKYKICELAYKFAEVSMMARQYGKSLPEAIKSAGDSDMARNLVIAAYKEEIYLSKDMKKQSITEFSNKVMLACLEQK